jgi:hypothetical protein
MNEIKYYNNNNRIRLHSNFTKHLKYHRKNLFFENNPAFCGE